jgi:hypoxanthine phosphoribosyltransferase
MTRPTFSAEELSQACDRLAAAIDRDHADDERGVVLVGVLTGAVVFASDLVRRLRVPAELDFLGVTPYTPGTGRVRLVKDLSVDVADRHVILVEDVVDTGLTLAYLMGELGRRRPASVKVCTMFDKRARRIVPVELAYVGFEVAGEYLLGYGLDHEGRYRNLPSVFTGDRVTLKADPDAYVPRVYPG